MRREYANWKTAAACLLVICMMIGLCSCTLFHPFKMTLAADKELQQALEEGVIPVFEDETGFHVKTIYEDSQTLRQQMTEGLQTDFLILKGEDSMKELLDKGLVSVHQVRQLLKRSGVPDENGNELIYVCAITPHSINPQEAQEFLGMFTFKYVRELLEKEGLEVIEYKDK